MIVHLSIYFVDLLFKRIRIFQVGSLFPGVFFNVIGAGTGAILVFLAARSGFGASVSARIAAAGGIAARLQTGLRERRRDVAR